MQPWLRSRQDRAIDPINQVDSCPNDSGLAPTHTLHKHSYHAVSHLSTNEAFCYETRTRPGGRTLSGEVCAGRKAKLFGRCRGSLSISGGVTFPVMEFTSATLDDLLQLAPTVLKELAVELYRRGDDCMKANATSQTTACFLLAFRATSLLASMRLLLTPESRDGWDVVSRSFMESRDLLLTFRFDDQGIRNAIRRWFEGKNDNAWKPRHKKCEEFVKSLGAGETELGRRWSAFSVLSHPTIHAAKHSTAVVVSWLTGRVEDLDVVMMPKVADYLVSISTLIVATTFEFPQWVRLECDLTRMPNVEPFRLAVAHVTPPIMGRTKEISLPPDSYRSS